MDPISRRKMLAATTAGSVLTAGNAIAQAVPQPMQGAKGANDPGPRNVPVDLQNPDILTPPGTDAGDLPNLKWSFGLSHNRLLEGGWARQTTIRELPVSKEIAGVDMRLLPGAIRELHWHKEAEWSIMLNGNARITAIDEDGRNFISDVQQGDLWYFPGGVPHSIQALDQGCEFLLVFDDGAFSEDSTFLTSEWFAHTPKEVLAKNLGHYIENTGRTTMRYLEMFRGSRYSDVSLEQWMALIPPELVKQHLRLDDATIAKLRKQKELVVGPAQGGSQAG